MHTHRTPIIAGNWKMNTTLADARVLASGLRDGAEHIERTEIVICPPSIWLTEVTDIVPLGKLPHLSVGAQNMYFEEKGAFTGEISPLMVKEVAEYVILGHSERVHVFKESMGLTGSKLTAAFAYGVTPILCIGEVEQSASSQDQVAHMLTTITADVDTEDMKNLIVAYEPVWAIGSGNPATPEYADQVMTKLREQLPETARVLYGGSVTQENARGYLELESCDGLLIGGTSLKLKDFLVICQQADDMAGTLGHLSKHSH